jgi:hypothetical protein
MGTMEVMIKPMFRTTMAPCKRASTSPPGTRWIAGAVLLVAAVPLPLPAVEPATDAYAMVRSLVDGSDKDRRKASKEIVEAGDPSLVPAIVDGLFYVPIPLRGPLVGALEQLTGEELGRDYYRWVELVARRSDLKPPPGYLEWKVSLLSRIDPTYHKIFYPGAPSRIRLEEIVWGGVPVDGIPPLENPPRVPATAAGFLSRQELVFGVRVGGESHAYPLRYLSWHEMVNDVVGGEPLTLSY